MEELTGREGGAAARDWRGPMTKNSGGGFCWQSSGYGRGGGALGTVAGKKEGAGKKGDNSSAPLFMGSSGAVFVFPAHDLANRGWDKFTPSGTWRHPERPIRPHRGPQGSNGWNSDRLRLPARESERRSAKSKTLKCFSGTTRPRVGPSPCGGILSDTNHEIYRHDPPRSRP